MPNFQAKNFFLVIAIKSAVKCQIIGRDFFWSTGMVVARWNLAGSECGPQDKKVADPCVRGNTVIDLILNFSILTE